MVLKRGFEDLGDDTSEYRTTHNHRFKLTKDISHLLREHSASLEASIRRVVREEVDQALQSLQLRQRLKLPLNKETPYPSNGKSSLALPLLQPPQSLPIHPALPKPVQLNHVNLVCQELTLVYEYNEHADYSCYFNVADRQAFISGLRLCPYRLPPDVAETSRSRNLRLKFDCRFPGRVFTGNRIEATGPEGSLPIKVILQDSSSGEIVKDGPLSSVKIEIVVLPGDFKAEDNGDWSESEFTGKVLCEREGKRPLLVGQRVLTMSGGVALVRNLSFTDNSSWVKSKKFRLGVRIAGSTPNEAGIMEAVSAALEVKDRRGEVYQKHGTPRLFDEVWRLIKIAKDGAPCRRLAENGILRVKDFLQMYYIDPSSLHKLLGVSSRVWEAIVEHATSCSLNDERYKYFSEEDGLGLMLNCVLNVVGVTFDGQNYQAPETLNIYQKLRVEELRRWLHLHQNNLVRVHSPAASTSLSSETVIQSAVSGLNQWGSDVKARGQGFSNLRHTSPSASYNSAHVRADQPGIQLESYYSEPPFSFPQEIQTVRLSSQPYDDVVPAEQSMQDEWGTGILSPTGHLLGEEGNMFGFHTSTWFPTLGEANSLLMGSSSNGSHAGLHAANPSFGLSVSGGRRSKARWSKVRAAVKFKILYKQGADGTKDEEFPFCFCANA